MGHPVKYSSNRDTIHGTPSISFEQKGQYSWDTLVKYSSIRDNIHWTSSISIFTKGTIIHGTPCI
jgi:hypothetical protein